MNLLNIIIMIMIIKEKYGWAYCPRQPSQCRCCGFQALKTTTMSPSCNQHHHQQRQQYSLRTYNSLSLSFSHSTASNEVKLLTNKKHYHHHKLSKRKCSSLLSSKSMIDDGSYEKNSEDHQSNHTLISYPRNYKMTLISSSKSSSTKLYNNNNDDNDNIVIKNPNISSIIKSILQKILQQHFFLFGTIIVAILSKQFPYLGANGSLLHPEILISQYGIYIIFLLSGLSLEFKQIQSSILNVKYNTIIQFYIFVIWPICIGLPIYYNSYIRSMISSSYIMDGILITSCFPTTINMCVALTNSCRGNVASSIINAVISNILGIIITPLWIFYFFAYHINIITPITLTTTTSILFKTTTVTTSAITMTQIPVIPMILKLTKKVVVPIVIGVLLRHYNNSIKQFAIQYNKQFKRIQDIILLSILWNAFCNALIQNDMNSLPYRTIINLIIVLSSMHITALGSIWLIYTKVLKNRTKTTIIARTDIISALFCSSQKTLAFGLPLLHTIFYNNPYVAYYSIPIILLHPLQVMIGSLLVSPLQKYVVADDDKIIIKE